MKNLRKVLALVLAVATLMSFAAMANAADFTDADKISADNKEAVEVLTALEVIKGKTETTFAPADTVKRGEMAKMIATIMNGGRDINETYKSSCTFADSKDHWAAGYIAYCATKGIINGKNENTFAPEATVTGVEAAKMVLCALGYSAETEGLTGTAWAGNTLNLADELQLFKNIAVAPGVAMTREAAAQLLFNGLATETVSYVGGSTVTVAGITFVSGGVLTGSQKALIEKCFPKASQAPSTDKFGRPGTEWTINGKSFNVLDVPVYSVVGTINIKNVYPTIGKKGADIANKIYYSEGTLATTSTGREMGKKAAANFPQMTSSKSLSWGGVSILHEVFYNEETDTLVYTTVQYRPGVISAVDTSAKTVTVDSYNKTTCAASGSPAATNALTFTGTAYTKADEGKFVLYALYDGDKTDGTDTVDSYEIYVPESKVITSQGGVKISSGMHSTLYTADGNLSGNYHAQVVGWDFGVDYTVYFDMYDKFVAAIPVSKTEAAKYVYVMAVATEQPTFGNATYLAQVLTTDGVVEVVETKTLATANTLYSYTVEKEVYDLTVADDTADTSVSVQTAKAGIGSYVANNNTLFVVETTVGTDKQYDVYTGIKNVPSLTVANMYVVANADNAALADVVYCMDAAKSGQTASTELDVSVLYIPASTPSTTTKEGVDGEAYSYMGIKAIINGAVANIKVAPAQYTAMKADSKNTMLLIDSYTLDANGVVTAYTKATTNLSETTITAKYADGLIGLGGTATFVDDTVVGYIYNSKSGVAAMQTVAVSKLPTNFKGWIMTDATTGAIVAFYGTASI